jgi:lambda family phage tail tape measure protein
MATIENFLLRFKVEGQGAIDKATKGIENLSNEVSQFGANTGPLNSALSGILGKLGPIGLAAGAAGGAFAALGLQAVNLAANISDIAGATGIAEGTLLNFRTSVIEAGGKADDFGTIAAKLNQSVQDAAGGNEKLQQSFKALGVFVRDAGGNIRNTEDILRDITQRFQEGEISGDKYAAAVDLLGKNINKLELSKLKAIADPVKDAEIKKLDQYAEAIDRVRDGLERGLLSFFGSAAIELEKVLEKFNQAKQAVGGMLPATERELNLQGQTRIPQYSPTNLVGRDLGNRLGSENRFDGLIVPREMTESEKMIFDVIEKRKTAAKETLAYETKMAGLMSSYKTRGGAGDFGAADPERLKREAEQRRKEGERAAEQLAKELQTVKDMTAGYTRLSDVNMQRFEMQRNLLGASEYEKNLVQGRAQIENRFADQAAALEAKKTTAKDATVKLIDKELSNLQGLKDRELEAFNITAKRTFEYQQQQEDLARITGEIEKQIDRQSQLGNIIRNINDQKVDINFERSLAGLTPLQQQIAKIQENARKGALEAGRSFSAAFDSEDGLTPERAEELAAGLEQIANGYKDIAQSQIEVVVGVDPLKEAFEDFKNNAMDTGKQMADSFENFTGGMEDAFVKFAQTGKLSFKDLANSIIADLIRIAVRRAIVAAVGGPLGSLFGFANGGPVQGATPIIVGERGPELFIPQSAGKIVSNAALKGSGSSAGQGGQTTVNYNIQAVDAASFRSLVAKDPSFIYAVTEQGRRSQPTRSR